MTTPKARKPLVVWFARGGAIARCGPYSSQIEATDAMRLVDGHPDGLFPRDVFVWPERLDSRAKGSRKGARRG